MCSYNWFGKVNNTVLTGFSFLANKLIPFFSLEGGRKRKGVLSMAEETTSKNPSKQNSEKDAYG